MIYRWIHFPRSLPAARHSSAAPNQPQNEHCLFPKVDSTPVRFLALAVLVPTIASVPRNRLLGQAAVAVVVAAAAAAVAVETEATVSTL